MGRSKRGGQKAAVVDDDDTEDILVTGDGGSNGAEDAKTLAADVAAMQAQLGLGGGGGGIGFDDRDFRPPSKKEVIVAAKDGKGKKELKKAGKTDPDGKEAPLPAGVKGRGWRESVGPRPVKDLSGAQPVEAEEETRRPSVSNRHPVIQQLLAGTPWYDQLEELKELKAPPPPNKKTKKGKGDKSEKSSHEPSEEKLAGLVKTARVSAASLLEQLSKAYDEEHQRLDPADAKWLATVRRSGTTADKLAAWTVVIQENLPANLRSLMAVLQLCSLKGKRQAAQAIEVMCELFGGVVLPERKLKYLFEQPLHLLPEAALKGDVRNKAYHDEVRRLVFWHVEDVLKTKYAEFVDTLSAATKDPLEHLKNKAMKSAQVLLARKPEQEHTLLRVLVNKLGDPARKVASNAAFLLTQTLEEHGAMSLVVAREVEGFLFRPGVTPRARYTAIVFLNQLTLSHRPADKAVAARLIAAYFAVFKQLIKENEAADKKAGSPGAHIPDVDARLASAILTGVRRAFPYVERSAADKLIAEHTPHLFALAHHERSFPTAVQALCLLHQLLAAHTAISDRFYRALYAALLQPALPTSTKASMLLALLFKAVKEDVSDKRAAAFVKRLLQVAAHAPSGLACGTLLIVSELLKARAALWSAVLQPEDHDDNEEVFRDDPADKLLRATRSGHGDVCDAEEGSDEDGQAEKGKKGGEMRGKVIDTGDVDSAEEDSEQEEGSEGEDGSGDEKEQEPSTGVVDMDSGDDDDTPATANGRTGAASTSSAAGDTYDMKKREPLYAHAEMACCWELAALRQHAHPSVAAMARSLLAGVPLVYAGDPIQSLSLSAFLDKFLSRKPKAAKGGSEKMRAKTGSAFGTTAAEGNADDMAALDSGLEAGEGRSAGRAHASSSLGVATAAFAALTEGAVAEEDVFFHKYYSSKAAAGGSKRAKKKDDDGSDSAEEGSDGGGDSDDDEEQERQAKPKKKRAAEAESEGDDHGSESEDGEYDDVQPQQRRGSTFDSDTDEEESAFLDRELQREVGIKADVDPVRRREDVESDSDGEYDYADLAAAMEESGDEDVGSGDESDGDGDDGDDDDASGSSDDDAFANKAMATRRGAGGWGSDDDDDDGFFSGLVAGESDSEEDGDEEDEESDGEPALISLASMVEEDGVSEEKLRKALDGGRRRKAGKKGSKKKKSSGGAGDFASADDFEEILAGREAAQRLGGGDEEEEQKQKRKAPPTSTSNAKKKASKRT